MAETPPNRDPAFELPLVEQEVIDVFEHHIPSFDELYKQLFASNPKLALYLLRRTDKLAPHNSAEKELYSRVALELAGLLQQQKIIDVIRGATDMSDLGFASNADEYGDGEVQPPAV